jgi:hypothetical protein
MGASDRLTVFSNFRYCSKLQIVGIAVILFLMCNSNLQWRKAHQVADILIDKYRANESIFDIRVANRFGEIVVVVSCVTEEDRLKMIDEIEDRYADVQFYFAGPIWPVGGLNPENAKKFESMLQSGEYSEYGTPKSKELDAFGDKIIQEDKVTWANWTNEQRRKWISDYIKKTRKRIPGFANCGDKFLIKE